MCKLLKNLIFHGYKLEPTPLVSCLNILRDTEQERIFCVRDLETVAGRGGFLTVGLFSKFSGAVLAGDCVPKHVSTHVFLIKASREMS